MKILITPINKIVYDEIEIHYEKNIEDGLILIDKIIELSEQYKKLETISFHVPIKNCLKLRGYK